MMRNLRPGFLLPAAFVAATFLSGVSVSRAQVNATSNMQYQVANLMEDVRLLDERIRQMQAQMDDMRRENDRMRQLIDDYELKAERNSSKFVTVSQLNEAIRQAAIKLEARDDEYNRKTMIEVRKALEDMAKELQKAVGVIRQPDPTPKQPPPRPADLPTTGIPYVVQPGDTISSIAVKFNSRIDWIMSINEIARPELLQVGRSIFVPQKPE